MAGTALEMDAAWEPVGLLRPVRPSSDLRNVVRGALARTLRNDVCAKIRFHEWRDAEARVRELEQERDTIEAQTIERCAEAVEQIYWLNKRMADDVAHVIRALGEA